MLSEKGRIIQDEKLYIKKLEKYFYEVKNA